MAFTSLKITREDAKVEILFRRKERLWRVLRELMIEFCSQGIEVNDRTNGKNYFINGTGKKIELSDENLGLKEVRKYLK